MPHRRALALATLLACTGVASDDPFSYDARAPLHASFAAPRATAAANVRDGSFDGGAAGSVPATLIVPAHAAGPAVLWVHWLGEPATTNRSEFRDEAQTLAARGVTSLLVDGMWAKPDWFEKGRTPANDERDLVRQVVALRRALDVLVEQPGVDPRHIALVGHDFGAMYGALAASVDPRVSALVLVTPAMTFWEWFLLGPAPTDVPTYVRQMSAYDLPARLPSAHVRAVLFQYAKRDVYVPATAAVAARSLLADRDRTIRIYDAEHPLALDSARQERDAWLVERLSSPAPG